jgi:ATP-dependent Lon protease
MFVATSNSLNIPAPLLDRMEVIRLSGYTEEEKIEIAKRHLIEKQSSGHGLKKNEWSISDEALRQLIRYYTREAGVRNLQREIASLTRKAVKKILMHKNVTSVAVNPKNLDKYAGVKRFSYGESEQEDLLGVVSGLAYTEAGGDLLTIEAVSLPGKGTVKCTGKLGEVMQESAQAAFSYARSIALELGITPPHFQKKDIHIHVPEGATPKDGPSAGVTMCTAIVSVLTGIPIKGSVAMTGEITLRGRVLPIGGLKEKLLAALRGGIKTVVIPKENEKDLVDIPKNAKKGLVIIPVATMDEVLRIALTRMPEAIEWTEEDELATTAAAQKHTGDLDTLRH